MKLKNNKYSTNSNVMQNIQKNGEINNMVNLTKKNIINENGEKNGLKISQTKEIEIGNNDKNNNLNNNKEINNKVLSTKKIVYHGQIKRKRNIIKNAKTYNNCQVKEIISNGNNNGNENTINYKNIGINNIKKDIDNNNNKDSNTSSKIKKNKLQSKQKVIGQKIKNNKSKENQIQGFQANIPQVYSQKKNIDLSININKYDYSFNNKNNNFHNVNNILEKNKSKNKTIINGKENRENIKSIVQSELPQKILLTESQILSKKEKAKNNNIKIDINDLFAKNKSSIKISEGEQYSRKNVKNNYNGIIKNNNNNQIIKKVTKDKVIKPKNYYGYDSYNIEGCINNHSYFVSVHSRKKDIQKNMSLNKIN
jgi:hypothetical protein